MPRHPPRVLVAASAILLAAVVNLAAAISLVLCAAALAVWGRSYHAHDRWSRGYGNVEADGSARVTVEELVIAAGFIKFSRFDRSVPRRLGGPRPQPGPTGYPLLYSSPTQRGLDAFAPGRPDLRVWGWGGFQYVEPAASRPPHYYTGGFGFALPLWALACLTAALPILRAPGAWRAARARSRRSRGRCPSCGYDLTANASGRCPECGTAVGNGTAATTDLIRRGYKPHPADPLETQRVEL